MFHLCGDLQRFLLNYLDFEIKIKIISLSKNVRYICRYTFIKSIINYVDYKNYPKQTFPLERYIFKLKNINTIVGLPQNVTHIQFGGLFDQLVDKLHQNVTHIKFADSFNQPVDKLPQNVTHIRFGGLFNQLVDKLPQNVTHIRFGGL